MTAELDFETYSEAGYAFDESLNKWRPTNASAPYGLLAVGAAKYAEHPSTEILCFAYDLHAGDGPKLWTPAMSPPDDLLSYVKSGGLIEAHNSGFEYQIWSRVLRDRMYWPDMPVAQWRCSASRARSYSMPGKLEKLCAAIGSDIGKVADGKRLIQKFSKPRNPTKNDPRRRHRPEDHPIDAAKLYSYCLGDVAAEKSAGDKLPQLSAAELELWLLDQEINARGMYIDRPALDDCIAVVKLMSRKYTDDLIRVTGGAVQTASEIQKLRAWLAGEGVLLPNLEADTVTSTLKLPDLPKAAKTALGARAALGSASVKKTDAILRRLCDSGRLYDLFMFCGADRTGRWSGRGPQPQNLPKSGPTMYRCEACRGLSAYKLAPCKCGGIYYDVEEWSVEAVELALRLFKSRDLPTIRRTFPDVLEAVSGCLRGLFIATPGHDLICSDYSAIEAVVAAMITGEQWRIDVFRTHGKIYEASAAKITGVDLAEILGYKARTGEHHPLRAKIGKFAELASAYQGSVGAWKAFGADAWLTDAEIKEAVDAWRAASPNIVDFWYSAERAAVAAVQAPGSVHPYKCVSYQMRGDVLFCRLPSGRELKYHTPRLTPDVTPWGKQVLKLSYMGTDKVGWIRMDTYGGKLFENIVQAIARDILADAMVRLDRAGYKIVLHVHDEVVAEVLRGFGSIEEFERIMATMPSWAADWPIKAAGGWRGLRYRKG